jgi:hypothetical protein
MYSRTFAPGALTSVGGVVFFMLRRHRVATASQLLQRRVATVANCVTPRREGAKRSARDARSYRELAQRRKCCWNCTRVGSSNSTIAIFGCAACRQYGYGALRAFSPWRQAVCRLSGSALCSSAWCSSAWRSSALCSAARATLEYATQWQRSSRVVPRILAPTNHGLTVR